MVNRGVQEFSNVNSLTEHRSKESLVLQRYDKLEKSNFEEYCYVNQTAFPEFYSSAKCLVDEVSDDLEQAEERRMANNICLRALLTIVHVVMGGGAAFYCMYSLLGWSTELDCLPRLVDHYGDPITIRMGSGLTTICHSINYGLAAVAVLSFIACFSINCLWRSTFLASVHLTMVSVFTAIVVFGGTTLTVHYLQWCDSLIQNGPRPYIVCRDAAKLYDNMHSTQNMTMYYRRLEVQQVSIWAMFPLALFTLLIYTALIRFFASMEQGEGTTFRQARYIILDRDEETTPLFSRQTEHPEASASAESRTQSSTSDFVTN